MSRDMEAPEVRGAPAASAPPAIQLRVEQFELFTRVVGATTAAARAELIGVDRKTIRRALDGVVGEVFMAATVAALRRHMPLLAACGLAPTLDALFEVVAAEDAAAIHDLGGVAA